jgi:hypothetical protein
MTIKQYKPADPGYTILPIKENINAMVNAAWVLSITCLWPFTCFSEKEMEEGKKHIRRFMINEADPYKAYMEYCQRILLLTKQRIHGPCHVIPQDDFFHPLNKNGFTQTEGLFKQLQHDRTKFRLYRQELKALSEAILDIAEEPDLENFHYWVSWFLSHFAYSEYTLFHSWIEKTGHNVDNIKNGIIKNKSSNHDTIY